MSNLFWRGLLTKVAQDVLRVAPEKRDPDKVSDALAGVSAELDRLEQRGASRGGTYLMGGDVTRADLTWLPFVELIGAVLEWISTPINMVGPKLGAQLWQNARPTIRPIPRIGGSINLTSRSQVIFAVPFFIGIEYSTP